MGRVLTFDPSPCAQSCQQVSTKYQNVSKPTECLQPGDAAYDVNVTAGENGMTCLTFNGETIRLLLTSALSKSWRLHLTLGKHLGSLIMLHPAVHSVVPGIYKDSPGFIPAAQLQTWTLAPSVQACCHSLPLNWIHLQSRLHSQATSLPPSFPPSSLSPFLVASLFLEMPPAEAMCMLTSMSEDIHADIEEWCKLKAEHAERPGNYSTVCQPLQMCCCCPFPQLSNWILPTPHPDVPISCLLHFLT